MIINPYAYAAPAGGGPTLVGVTHEFPTTTSAHSADVPAGAQAGDLLVAVVAKHATGTPSPVEGGWTALNIYSAGTGSTENSTTAGWHRTLAGDESSFSFNTSTGGIALFVVRGSGLFIDAQTGEGESTVSPSTPMTFPGVTLTADALLVGSSMRFDRFSASGAMDAPSGFTDHGALSAGGVGSRVFSGSFPVGATGDVDNDDPWSASDAVVRSGMLVAIGTA